MSLTYHRPKTLPEAVELARTADIALAGGALTFGGLDVPYSSFVDLQDVPELNRFDVGEHRAIIGSNIMLSELLKIEWLPSAMRRALTRAIPPNILNRTSVGESFKQHDHPLLREWMAVCTTIEVQIQRSPVLPNQIPWMNARAIMNADDVETSFLTCFVFSRRQENEHLVGLAHVSRTPTDAAIVCVSAPVHVSSNGSNKIILPGSMMLAGVSSQTFIDIRVEDYGNHIPLLSDVISSYQHAIDEQIESYSDHIASANYRRAMAKVCAKRALMDCAAQLGLT